MSGRALPTSLLLALVAATGWGCVADGPASGTRTLRVLEYEGRIPAAWESREPESSMRVAELVTDPGEGEASPQVVVYFFGAGQGGSVEANVARWRSQFTAPDGGSVVPEIQVLEGTAFPTTLVALEGAYARGVGMGPQTSAEPGQALVAAVVETPAGNLYAQLFGPAGAVASERDAFVTFLESLGP